MDVAVVLEYDDFASAEAHRNKDGGDASKPTMSTLAKNRTTINPSLFEEITSDNEDFGLTDQTQVGTKCRPTTVNCLHIGGVNIVLIDLSA